ncbi:L,D-transpeptidase family protein [Segetibacter sp.]|jgi:murein L,D-transpeptidase YcbB/YkuD|uniref:L,D-transpeptidase family protein n=1 Tax=Segetibacter sp. TaxID=2231182 RepID=UPI0026255650|nr:L,D-transpeptidase family protein [Segetibacter sp.]MCW3079883.1 L,D-transpeptidase family protein [Segetibacter sp.]
MKRLIIYALVLSLFAACNSKDENDSTDEGKTEQTTEKKISKRDYSISSSNSYTDLFLDSLAVEKYIAENKVNDTISRRMRSFYNARNYQFAWFSSDGPTEEGRSFWNLHEYSTTYNRNNSSDDKKLKKKMDYLLSEESVRVGAGDKSMINTEISVTSHFIEYILENYQKGEIKRKEMERFVPFKKADAMYLADSLLTKKHKDNKYYADVNPAYRLLKEQLQKYYDITKRGGWQPIVTKQKTIKKGSSSSEVLAVKKRLEVTGEMQPGDTSQLFDDRLENAVKAFQVSRGLTPTGTITSSLIKEMNVSALKRVEQLLINMGRMRWMLTPETGNLLLVNIPEFILHVYEGKNEAFSMEVVVGKEGHNTTMFTGNLNQVVFSPYWNVPVSIVKNEILPAMANDPDYLSRNNMEEVAGGEDGLPAIRQLPGPKNSLGKVKFLFPNSYDIYFHDTPAKSLFSSDKRAFSHGCIRLSDPTKLARYVLRDQTEWTPERIDEAMNSGQEQFVKVKKAIPVLITYYTAWVDENGVLNFRDDIYNHDVTLSKKMFTNPL